MQSATQQNWKLPQFPSLRDIFAGQRSATKNFFVKKLSRLVFS
jgi:hypothetical protein